MASFSYSRRGYVVACFLFFLFVCTVVVQAQGAMRAITTAEHRRLLKIEEDYNALVRQQTYGYNRGVSYSSYESLKNENEKLRQELESRVERVKELASECAELEAELRLARQENEKQQSELRGLNTRLVDTREELSKARQETSAWPKWFLLISVVLGSTILFLGVFLWKTKRQLRWAEAYGRPVSRDTAIELPTHSNAIEESYVEVEEPAEEEEVPFITDAASEAVQEVPVQAPVAPAPTFPIEEFYAETISSNGAFYRIGKQLSDEKKYLLTTTAEDPTRATFAINMQSRYTSFWLLDARSYFANGCELRADGEADVRLAKGTAICVDGIWKVEEPIVLRMS